MTMNSFQVLTIYLSALMLLIGGCASTKEKVFNNVEMKTMGEIYDDTFGSALTDTHAYTQRSIEDNSGDVMDFTRTSRNELEGLFKELPNPKLIMYVYPHITPSNLPVPGYTTTFRMYDRAHFAMPGER